MDAWLAWGTVLWLVFSLVGAVALALAGALRGSDERRGP
jgi:hypothetical protein